MDKDDLKKLELIHKTHDMTQSCQGCLIDWDEAKKEFNFKGGQEYISQWG